MERLMDTDIPAEFRRRAEAALGGRLAKVVLFGSRARGDSEPDSDWDLAVFLRGPLAETDRFTLSDAAYDILLETGQFIQTIVFPLRRESEDTLLMRNIRSEGRPV
jgi:predicted nucleotidyltransferase